MIFDSIDRKIREMKDLRRLEILQDNRAQQEATDARYKALITQVQVFLRALKYAIENHGFFISDLLQSNLSDLFASLKWTVQSGYADKDTIVKAENDFKSIQANVKREWGKYYSAYTASTVNTLRVISGIAFDRVEECIGDIKAAENWSIEITVLSKLKAAMNSADTLIKSLDMDQETVNFLTKMTSGKATLHDLNEKVIAWVKREVLENKIKLSFIMK